MTPRHQTQQSTAPFFVGQNYSWGWRCLWWSPDRKSTRLNSSHDQISYAVFCLKKKNAIQNRVASNIGISQSTFSVKVLNLFSRSRRKTNKRKSKPSAMLRNQETRHRMFIGLLNTNRKLA